MKNILKDLREKHHETLDDIASLCHVSRQSVFNWENDFSEISVKNAIKICSHYNISLDTFFCLKKNNYPIHQLKDSLDDVINDFLEKYKNENSE